jgi:hypothetical protein
VKSKIDGKCKLGRPVRTIMTIILCMYERICYLQACHHVTYESNALYVVYFSITVRLCHPEHVVPLPSVGLAVRCVLQFKNKRAMKVRSDV